MNARETLREAMAALKRGEHERARADLESVVAAEPNWAEAHNALGMALATMDRREPAARAFLKALVLRPEFPEALTNLGNLDMLTGELSRARQTLGRAAAGANPPLPAFVGLGRVEQLLGNTREASAAYERVASHPDADPSLQSLRCYASLLDPELDARAVIALHRTYEQRVPVTPRADVTFANARTTQRKLRLGYVSANFHEHSVADFLLPILRAHDRRQFELVAYSDVPREDATTGLIRGLFDRFHVVTRLPHDRLAQLVREHQVDVLIDLAGHTQPNRLPMFAARPAPVLLTYLGYPGSTGLSAFDGRISDGWADPSDMADRTGPEQVLRIEGGYFAYEPPGDAPEVSERPRGAPFTFGNMAHVTKLCDDVLATWAEILRHTPGSRLLLKSKPNAYADVRERIQRRFASLGVDTSRLDLRPATAGRREHLATYADVDVALDTFPYAGAATTCEALYMGVPVVTLEGDRHAARMGVSILNAAGLGGYVARDREQYVDLAVKLALEPAARPGRAELRAKLRASPLFDGRRVADAIERHARRLFAAWCKS